MPRALWLPDLLRDFGLEPVLVDGWERRGSEAFNPRGSIDHHTAGAATGYIPSLRVLINGRSDLPGPLCNVAQPRNADGDSRVYVVAAGRANHAGRGGWKGLSGNSSVLGLERENVGTSKEPWSAWSFEVACRVHAAFAKGAGFFPDYVCRHAEWAPGRKVDTHSVTGLAIRNRVRDLLAGPVHRPTPQEVVRLMFDPPARIEFVAFLAHPKGGAAFLLPDGGVNCYGCPFNGNVLGKPYFAGRRPAKLLPNPQYTEGGANPWYVVQATSGEIYGYTGF